MACTQVVGVVQHVLGSLGLCSMYQSRWGCAVVAEVTGVGAAYAGVTGVATRFLLSIWGVRIFGDRSNGVLKYIISSQPDTGNPDSGDADKGLEDIGVLVEEKVNLKDLKLKLQLIVTEKTIVYKLGDISPSSSQSELPAMC